MIMLIDLLACWNGLLGLPVSGGEAGRTRRGSLSAAGYHIAGRHDDWCPTTMLVAVAVVVVAKRG
jgi:hypothetical protein